MPGARGNLPRGSSPEAERSRRAQRLATDPPARHLERANGPSRRHRDAADDWIVEHISAVDVCVTSDIPLGSRCLKKGARVVSPAGKHWTQANIGNARPCRSSVAFLLQQRQQGGERCLLRHRRRRDAHLAQACEQYAKVRQALDDLVVGTPGSLSSVFLDKLRRRSASQNQPWRVLEKVKWSDTSPSTPRRQNRR
jgi:uncharacterized protein YaiI (UPF0178 family)